MFLVSISFFLQGHNLPGGGFIGGVMTAAALSLVYIVFDRQTVKQIYCRKRKLMPSYMSGLGAGLFIAAGTGVVAMLMGLPFLTHGHGKVDLLLAEIHLSTAVAFDLGVYIVVATSSLTIVEVLAEA